MRWTVMFTVLLLAVSDSTQRLSDCIFTERHAILVEILGSDKGEGLFGRGGDDLIELCQFEEAAGVVGDAHYSFVDAEALRDQPLQLVALQGFCDCDLLVLALEFELDLIHL